MVGVAHSTAETSSHASVSCPPRLESASAVDSGMASLVETIDAATSFHAGPQSVGNESIEGVNLARPINCAPPEEGMIAARNKWTWLFFAEA